MASAAETGNRAILRRVFVAQHAHKAYACPAAACILVNAVVVVLVVALASAGGCMFERGLSDSSTDCATRAPSGAGVLVAISDPELLAGRCMSIAHNDSRIDDPFAFSKVDAGGRAFLPVDGAGSFYLSVSANLPDDNYCQRHVGVFLDHPGTGILERDEEAATLCA